MASEEHKRLAEIIKKVHQTLRMDARVRGVAEAWKVHCEQHDVLELYAAAMYELATVHWESDSNKLTNSRISWIVNHCIQYFMNGGKSKEKLREMKRFGQLLSNVVEDSACSNDNDTECDMSLCNLTLLDVGSCYNPFKKYSFFKILPIDLKPACSDVFEADFLNLPFSSEAIQFEDITNEVPIRFLPENYFDIVVFSLLLEYMPSCEQRYFCCEKAYKLLKREGLLFIITPDSKHATANSSIMKNWRICMSQMGFSRIFYEKLPHIHCMAFRKNNFPILPQLWAQEHLKKQSKPLNLLNELKFLTGLMQIPQDSTEYVTDVPDNYPKSDQDLSVIVDMFEALPSELLEL